MLATVQTVFSHNLIGLNYWLKKTIQEMIGLGWSWTEAVLGLRLWMGPGRSRCWC